MERPVFGKKSCSLQRPRVDRFMPPREVFADVRRRRSLRHDADDTINIWEAKHQKQKKFRNYLDEVFGLEPTKTVDRSEDQNCMQPWPCAPRKKTFLSSADSILDLPTYSYSSFPEVLDWSSTNMLVAALGNNYHMYSWKTQIVMGKGVTMCPIQCCKFDPKGDLLLIGTLAQTVEIHDSVLNKMTMCDTCKCVSDIVSRPCAITAVDWSPTGNSFITGCSRGYVISFDRRSLCLYSWRRLSLSAVMSVRISPDTRYVASIVLNSSNVHVLLWPSLEYYFSLNSNWFVKTISWHPWRSALLGVGVMTADGQTTIALWDTPSSKVREARLGCYNDYSLDVMLFSHRTGELVLSLWNSDQAATLPKASSQLVVMSDPYTVVDQSGEGRVGLDRVRTMVFSPDGTKLATATADEDLIIWNFLPEDKKKKDTKPRRFSAIPVYLDQVTNGFVVR